MTTTNQENLWHGRRPRRRERRTGDGGDGAQARRAAAHVFTKLNPRPHPAGARPKIVLGKDTRLSGYMLENALVAGITSLGVDVLLIGPLPTPGVAYITRFAARRCRDRALRFAQSLRRQRHQILPARWLQARRRGRATNRAAGFRRRDRFHPADGGKIGRATPDR